MRTEVIKEVESHVKAKLVLLGCGTGAIIKGTKTEFTVLEFVMNIFEYYEEEFGLSVGELIISLAKVVDEKEWAQETTDYSVSVGELVIKGDDYQALLTVTKDKEMFIQEGSMRVGMPDMKNRKN